MEFIFIVTGIYLLLGAVGMHFGNKKVDVVTAAKRWLKYFTYLLITAFLIASILLDFFLPVAVIIVGFGFYEMQRTARAKKFWLALLIYSIAVSGFLFFAYRFDNRFQFFIYFQVFSFDAFCQITGQLFGRHPITKRISPSKTVEGLLGGIIICLLSALLGGKQLDLSASVALCIGLVTSLASLVGDLSASFYKRVAGIKDYSNLLPGQGGFLDRFDSFIMTGFVYSFLSFFIS